jgi:hypothetical protein
VNRHEKKKAILLDAIQLWAPTKNELNRTSIQQHWFGTNTHTTLTVIEYAKYVIDEFDRNPHKLGVVLELIKLFEKQQSNLVGYQSHWDAKFACHRLAIAIASTSLAVLKIIVQDDGKAGKDLLNQSATIFEDDRRIGIEKLKRSPWSTTINPNKKMPEPEKRFAKVMANLETSLSSSTVLSIAEIVHYIVRRKRGNHDRNPVNMLVTSPQHLGSEDLDGDVISGIVRAFEAVGNITGPFIDPLTFGIADINKKFLSSVRHAWRIMKAEAVYAQNKYVKISLSSRLKSFSIGGSSAGGLLAAAICATVDGISLNPSITSTCSLEIDEDDDNPDSENIPLPGDQVPMMRIGGITLKSQAAVAYGIREIAVTSMDADQQAASDESVKIIQIASFEQLFQALTRENFEVKKIEECCSIISGQWDILKTNTSDRRWDARDYSHRIEAFVPSRFTVLNGPEDENAKAKGASLTDEQAVSILSLALKPTDRGKHLASGINEDGCFRRNLLVYDRMGAGKSVATLRFAHLLTQEKSRKDIFGYNEQPLVVRIEGDNWPKESGDFQTLLKRVGARVRDLIQGINEDEAYRVAEFALHCKRLIIIIDGFDQMSYSLQKHVLKEQGAPENNGCFWIITTRQQAVNEIICSDVSQSRYIRVMLERFGVQEQNEYFKKAGIKSWRKQVNVSIGSEFLQSPYNLRRLRELLQLTDKVSGNWEGITIESESQLGITSYLRNLEKLTLEFMNNVASQRLNLPPLDTIGLLDFVLSTIAFQMMLERRLDGSVRGDEVIPFQDRCMNRFIRAAESKFGNRDWDFAFEILKRGEFDFRSWIEQLDTYLIEFQSRKAMELFAARFLSRYASLDDIFGYAQATSQSGELCALDFIADTDWFDTWRLAIEMPRYPLTKGPLDSKAVFDEKVLCHSLSALFRVPKHGLRPTELIYRCWHLFAWDHHLFRERWVRTEDGIFQSAEMIRDSQGEKIFESIGKAQLFGANNPTVRKIATDAIELYRSTNYQIRKEMEEATNSNQLPSIFSDANVHLQQWQQKTSFVKSRTMLRLPPVYAEGQDAPSLKSNFWMQATPVTRGMYSCFDSAIAESTVPVFVFDGEDCQMLDVLARYASPRSDRPSAADLSDFPIIGVTMYDAFAFAKWLGDEYRLPRVDEWQAACRASSKFEFAFGPVLTAEMANFIATNQGRCVRVGESNFPPNAWGLFDMHGNVIEWCALNEIHKIAYAACCGGSFACTADQCRLDRPRLSFARSTRDCRIGFRLVYGG